MTEVLHLVDPAALADLGRYAARARAVDGEGAMRLQAGGGSYLAGLLCLKVVGDYGLGLSVALLSLL